ncbi:Kinetochore-associated protein MTW1 [Candida viswanathii]|uniref:Kinetochore-associated protein MTW1 n=1 Tax=Candida viswanathii TaxID=5486 RepID=A0A367YPN6_9ASCO|nr:Kinetochore-associated protein MTW1 [Candida viswanathii]
MTDTSDKSLDPRTTAILTEHFGFAPLVLIDEIINAVNEIMYKGTEAIEAYLKEQQGVKTTGAFTEITTDEIETGVGKLETLLESTVDSYFDKFELYCFRNVLNVPKELIPWVVLNHQRDVTFERKMIKEKKEVDEKVAGLSEKIERELQLRRLLKLEIAKVTKMVTGLKEVKKVFEKLENVEGSQELLKKLQPIDETMYFLSSEIRRLVEQIERFSGQFQERSEVQKFVGNARDKFIDHRAQRILSDAGLLKDTEKGTS